MEVSGCRESTYYMGRANRKLLSALLLWIVWGAGDFDSPLVTRMSPSSDKGR